MKKVVMFLLGLLLLVLTGVCIYFAGGIFDAGTNQRVYPYFFQPDNLSERRPGVPQTAEYMGDAQFFDLLVRKYVTEYFYAAPDPENIARRMSPLGALARMSATSVFDEWKANQGVVIQNLAAKKSLRTVRIIDKIYQPNGGQYWVVNYELKTWEKPNDFSVAPVVTRGTMYMDIEYKMGMRTDYPLDTIHNHLESGGELAAVFQFKVNRIIQG